MKVGDLVKVKTKLYGALLGLVIKDGMDGWFIQPVDHPQRGSRMIIAQSEDIELIK